MNSENFENDIDNLKKELLRYFSFWPLFLISFVIFLSITFVTLRYTDSLYRSISKIQVIDKANDSDMALPSAMTIFNRSMVNLENEIGVLGSYKIHQNTVNFLNANVKYYTEGLIKTSEVHYEDFLKYDEKFEIIVDPDTISIPRTYKIKTDDKNLEIEVYDFQDNLIDKVVFNGSKSTFNTNHNLPFNINLKSSNNLILKFFTPDAIIKFFKSATIIEKNGMESDQLSLYIDYPVPKITRDYLNTLMIKFDNDGINDRQLEYKRTIQFVDSRSFILKDELQSIENRKQEFKEINNLSDIQSDAYANMEQKIVYDSELFNAKSQLELVKLLENNINNEKYNLLPVDIGITNTNINQYIEQYNIVLQERERYMINAGPNNLIIKNLEKQLGGFFDNIISSIQNYKRITKSKIENLENKEEEYSDIFNRVPENEKILRSIERELKIKESLYLLLLQKREEAAINLAVVKPSIKVIDNALTRRQPVYPNKTLYYGFAIFASVFIPFISLYLIFYFDNKIHTRDDLINLFDKDISIISEIPNVDNIQLFNNQRSGVNESFRMLVTNLKFYLSSDKNNIKKNVILTTSTIKGEGKTIVSTNVSKLLSQNNKVLLLGADLRNPQIHKFFNKNRDEIKGLTNYIFSQNNKDWKDYVIKINNLDILFSGDIPPNPRIAISNNKLKDLIKEAKNIYDYVIVDSAPCLLVSDTLEISKLCDMTLYVFRANYTPSDLSTFIKELVNTDKVNNLSLVFNGVGDSNFYGYKYGYQYGYSYGYKYAYNYGYGYGYGNEDKDKENI